MIIGVRRTHRRAQALVETALVLPLFITIALGVTQVAVLFRDSLNLSESAKQGAAEASGAGSTTSDGVREAQAFWDKVEPGVGPIEASAAVSGRYVVVTTKRTDRLFFPPYVSLTLRGRGQNTLEVFRPGSGP